MAYDEELVQRVRGVLALTEGIDERNMFGGVAFLHHGNMLCGVIADDLMVRVGPEAHDAALQRDGAREMDFTGRAMRGMVLVEPAAIADFRSLNTWVKEGLAFVRMLPAKGQAAPRAAVGTGPFRLLPGGASSPDTKPAATPPTSSAKKKTTNGAAKKAGDAKKAGGAKKSARAKKRAAKKSTKRSGP